jgi:hypothetical protein
LKESERGERCLKIGREKERRKEGERNKEEVKRGREK